MDVDDTLALILERIDSPVSLIHAASTCRRWHRVIADISFLRRFRSLHGPPVAGDYYNHRNHYNRRNRIHDATGCPSFVPSSSIDARHFSLDFVVDMNIIPPREIDGTTSWNVLDSRGSLLLMKFFHKTHFPGVYPDSDLVVCEPLTQRYKIIPRPLDLDGDDYFIFQCPYLVDGDEDVARGSIGMSNFRVLWVLFSHYDDVAHTVVFTASAMDSTWSEKAIDHIASRLRPRVTTSRCLGHVLGSRYFYIQQDGMLITCNGSTGKSSSSVLPHAIKCCWDHHFWTENFFIVDGGDGEPRIIALKDHTMEVFGRVDGEWALENKILLSKKVTCNLPGYPLSFNGCPTIRKERVGFIVISWWDLRQHWYFSIDLRTMEVAPVANGSMGKRKTYRCEFPWPPILNACLDR